MALDFQILLLPRGDYWAWLRSCRDYVRAFGANLTSDPGVAARYMRPSQVVTLPVFEGAYPDLGDPVAWFHKNHDGIRLDPIRASSPEELSAELNRRAVDNDRYGALRRTFHLVWPTDYPVMTQPFGVNPQVYRRYGMPGHEGVDLRALTNSNIYASADGEVYEVYPYPKPHAYGIHVRIRHSDGYKTVYAHLARPLVRKGDWVRAGQLIGRANSTGNSSAAHLHLSLKRDGATARHETSWPKDILDPTPYLVWPAGSRPKSAPRGRSTGAAGLSVLRDEGPTQADLRLVGAVRPGALMIGLSTSREAIEALRRSAGPDLRLLVRVATNAPREPEQPARFVARLAPAVGRLARLRVLDFEPVLFPNEQRGGFGTAWRDGEAFGDWFQEIRRRLLGIFPGLRVGFPALAPGVDVRGRQQSASTFLEQASAAAAEADWIGIAAPLVEAKMAAEAVQRWFPEKPLILTDLGTGADPVSATVRFAELVRELGGMATSTIALLDASSIQDGYSRQEIREVAGILGRLQQPPPAPV